MNKPSSRIAAFLDFLRECEMEYKIALDEETEADQKTQDILHTLEFDSRGYHDGAKLAREMAAIRQARRAAKNAIAQRQPIMDWKAQNDRAIHSLEKLLGEVRRAERSTEGRTYSPRTDIVDRILGGDDQ